MSREESHRREYPATVLKFEGGPRLELRYEPSAEERRALVELELGPTFAVLTAESPGDLDPDAPPTADELAERERENVRRTLRLEEHLARHGIPFRRVEAMAPDGSHHQRCVAVALPRQGAEALARDRDQVALLWYDGSHFWPWPAQLEPEPRPLPGP